MKFLHLLQWDLPADGITITADCKRRRMLFPTPTTTCSCEAPPSRPCMAVPVLPAPPLSHPRLFFSKRFFLPPFHVPFLALREEAAGLEPCWESLRLHLPICTSSEGTRTDGNLARKILSSRMFFYAYPLHPWQAVMLIAPESLPEVCSPLFI